MADFYPNSLKTPIFQRNFYRIENWVIYLHPVSMKNGEG